MSIEFAIPFVPVAGMSIAPNGEADFVKVEDVFWAAVEPDLIECFIVKPDANEPLRPFAYWKTQGWKKS